MTQISTSDVLERPESVALDESSLASLTEVSRELDSSYRTMQEQVLRLRTELAISRGARLRELAEKERLLNRLASLLAVLPGGVMILDPEQTIRDANPAALDMLGEPLLGETWPQVAKRNPELDERQPGQRQLSINSRALDDDGEDGERVVLITDTTELHDLQLQLGRRERLAALGEMAARLAHQIRTPLSSATLYLSQLGSHDLPHVQRDKISERLGDRLQHMEALIESMLSFVRGENPHMEPLLLRDVMTTLESAVRETLPSTVSLTVTPIDDTLALSGARDELVGALANLVNNAVEVGGESVRVDIWAGATSHDSLQICVRDNGPGIPSDVMPRLFDPFFTTRTQGTGLGLAVVAKTVSHHGGEVRARNRAQGGAEFLIDLPLLATEESCGDSEVVSNLISEANEESDGLGIHSHSGSKGERPSS
ncbi:sensor histidine kinase [Congregibacter sp.]|uniref:sensor histidine kinase n=1 Tax=Congregibacter sp. TaxID=2744308 RepID=UPI00385E6DB0